MQATNSHRQQGFTLIELSIVLVIIGLIVGGILVGQDMIRSAELRATISQLEKISSAVNTFRGKYNAMPGDISNEGTYGFLARTNAAGVGDGNGLIEGGATGAVVPCGETILFYNDLSTANMIENTYSGGDGASGGATCNGGAAVTAATMPTIVPAAKMGKGNHIFIYAYNGLHYFQVAGATAITTAGAPTLTNAITPQEASTIDTKIDDGQPGAGGVQAMRSTTTLNTTAADGDACRLTSVLYQTASANAVNTPACQMRFRASF